MIFLEKHAPDVTTAAVTPNKIKISRTNKIILVLLQRDLLTVVSEEFEEETTFGTVTISDDLLESLLLDLEDRRELTREDFLDE